MAKTIASATATAVQVNKPWLSTVEMNVLEAICDTLIPALPASDETDPHGFLRRPASAMQVAQRMAETLGAEDAQTQAEFRQLLAIVRNRVGGTLLIGRPIGFLKMRPDQREQALRAMANSNIAKLRQGFQAIKRLAAFVFYSAPAPDGSDNPNWPAIQFATPAGPHPVPKPIRPLAIASDTALEADVIVVGSGAGGGVIAAQLAAAGKAVIILEKGGYFNEADFDGHEASMMPKLYLKRGLQSTRDLSMAILAGSCLGGGTVVNWSTSLRMPDEVLHEWERNYGLDGFTTGFAQHYDAVAARVDVNTTDSAPNANNAIIERGCDALGWSWGVIPRNANHCQQQCGACGYGCTFSRKQSTLLTYLDDANQHGARFIVNCSVDRVTQEQGVATGVIATALDPDTGARHQVTVRARTVVIAAGALHSPAILLRSGIGNPHLGRNLHLHPVVAVTGFYPEPILGWNGSLQTRYSMQFAPKGEYGFTFEVAPIHPGLIGLSLPWESGQEHKALMQRVPYAGSLIVLARDKNSGRVTLDKMGEPVVDYFLGEHERRMLTQGTVEGIKLHLAAGAIAVGTLHNRRTLLDVPADGNLPAIQLKNFLRDVEDRGLEPNRTLLFSAHQMGSCRMAADPKRGVIGNDNAVFGVKGLYVADGSAFPTASGVNPMLTILALAHRAAAAILANS